MTVTLNAGRGRAHSRNEWRTLLGIGLLLFLAGCASLPPGSDSPKTTSIALSRPEQTRMGLQLAAAKADHPGTSGFKLLPVGIDSFLLRMEMAGAAARTLDVEYFLIQSDDTGQLLIDRQRVFVGSMNLDQRSLHLNTEIGLIIDSPELARQIAARFAEIAKPANSYVLVLGDADALGHRHLVWRTLEDGKPVDFEQEPATTIWERMQVDMLSLLPLNELL